MRILLAGGSGALGRLATGEMTAAGHEVTTLGRGPANDVRADLLDREALLRAVDGRSFDAVVHAATALSGKSMARHSSMDATDALRAVGTPHLVEAARVTGARRFVAESMMYGYGYGDHGEALITESGTPYGPRQADPNVDRHVGAMRAKEEAVLGADGIEGVALRFGLFYGPGATDTSVLPMLRRRALPVPHDDGFTQSWVDVRDAARALSLALTEGRHGEAYNIADGHYLSFGTHVRAVAEAFGTPRPLTMPRWMLRAAPLARTVILTRLRMDSAKAAAELGWRPAHPAGAEGLRALAADLAAMAA